MTIITIGRPRLRPLQEECDDGPSRKFRRTHTLTESVLMTGSFVISKGRLIRQRPISLLNKESDSPTFPLSPLPSVFDELDSLSSVSPQDDSLLPSPMPPLTPNNESFHVNDSPYSDNSSLDSLSPIHPLVFQGDDLLDDDTLSPSSSDSSSDDKDNKRWYWKTSLAPSVAKWLCTMPSELSSDCDRGDRVETLIRNIREMNKLYESIQQEMDRISDNKESIRSETDLRNLLRYSDVAGDILEQMNEKGFTQFMASLS